MNNDKRTYWIALHTNGKPLCGLCGRNAKRDAYRAARSVNGTVLRTTGAGWDEIARRRR